MSTTDLKPTPTSALAHASTNVPTALPEETVGEIQTRLAGAPRFDSVADVVVLADGVFVGIIPLEVLLSTDISTPAIDVIDPDPPTVAPGADQEAASLLAVAHHESSLAVVGTGDRFLGLIPPHRMLGVLLEEHREDMARLSGYLHQSAAARSASEESLPRRFWHRFPWLAIGLAGAMATVVVVSAFEAGLASRVELAFFIPGVVYIAGAVGNQTVTLVVRGLSVGVPLRRMVVRELVTGVALGAVLGLLAYPVVAVWFGGEVAVALSLSIWSASSVATAVAMTLPWLFSLVRIDPAFGSGPLSTVVQDMLSLTIYLGFATILVL